MLEDFELLQEIYSIVGGGIQGQYDQMSFEILVGDGYIDTDLTLWKDGHELQNGTTNCNDARLYSLVKDLHQRSVLRDEPWKSLKISCKHGAQVDVQYVREGNIEKVRFSVNDHCVIRTTRIGQSVLHAPGASAESLSGIITIQNGGFHPMRIAACLLLAALHASLAATFSGITFDVDISLLKRLVFGVTALALWSAAGLLATRPFIPLPPGAVTTFRAWCLALPVLYFIASLDHGMISGLEFLLGLFVAGFSWVTWRTFNWAKRSNPPAA